MAGGVGGHVGHHDVGAAVEHGLELVRRVIVHEVELRELDPGNLGDFQHYAGNGELVEYLAKHGNIVERQTMFSQIGHRFGCDRVLRLELLLIGCRGKIVQRKLPSLGRNIAAKQILQPVVFECVEREIHGGIIAC